MKDSIEKFYHQWDQMYSAENIQQEETKTSWNLTQIFLSEENEW